MLVSSTIWVLILAIIPVILYSRLVYETVPTNFVSLKKAKRYLVSGLFSPMLISLFYFLFPNWGDAQSSNLGISIFILAFLQVGFLEEFVKYIINWQVGSERVFEKYDLPIATMFYSMMVAVGFAITENVSYLISEQNNINYLQQYIPYHLDSSQRLTSIALGRSLSAVIVHMICGVIMGYFLSKAHILKYQNPKNIILRYKTILSGIAYAALFHGVYDYNLFLEDNKYSNVFAFMIIIFGLFIGNFIINDLIKDSKILKDKQDLIKECHETEK